jgi:hypothetical protein
MEYLEKLELELDELSEKIYRIKTFQSTTKFRMLDHKHKVLLLVQESTMENYSRILKSRIELIKEDPNIQNLFKNYFNYGIYENS